MQDKGSMAKLIVLLTSSTVSLDNSRVRTGHGYPAIRADVVSYCLPYTAYRATCKRPSSKREMGVLQSWDISKAEYEYDTKEYTDLVFQILYIRFSLKKSN